MCILLYILLFVHCVVTNSHLENNFKTLHGHEPPDGQQRTFIFNADGDDELSSVNRRQKRQAENLPAKLPIVDDGIKTKVNHLKDNHKQLMVHWVGESTKVVICLARDVTPIIPGIPKNPSTVYISNDDGDTYENKTDMFKTPNGSYAILEKFYNHPKLKNQFIFTDVQNNLLFITNDLGKTFLRRELSFTPSEVSYHEVNPKMFVVLDKNDTNQKIFVTDDYGQTFRPTVTYVKSFAWIKEGDQQKLIIQRTSGSKRPTSIFYYDDIFKTNALSLFTTNVQDFYVKGDYIFTTSLNQKGELDLYVSHKFGPQYLCEFDTNLKMRSFLITDVTNQVALIAVSHSEVSSNLYVGSLVPVDNKISFTLSLEDVFAFFPEKSWQDTWLHNAADDVFADIYKIEGLTGIYIASKVVTTPEGIKNTLSPQHLGSVITFNHGATWRLIEAPFQDIEGQPLGCSPTKNCSLHLSQKFSQLYPESKSLGILTSKYAPGVILAMGVIGRNLKGHYGVYISLDAGLTWRQTLRDMYFFNMGDYGGIFSAVKYYRNKGETRHIEYSTDGETWNNTQFHNEDLKLYGLMTEPGENTTVFTMFGSLPDYHQWIIVKVDLKGVFNRSCGKDDYKMWSPGQNTELRSYIPCVMGVQTSYQRRMLHAKCLNGLNYVPVVSKQVCDCDVVDFECDFGFKKVGSPARCVLDKTTLYNPYKIPANCKPGQYFNRTKGYKKISGDICVGGFESHYLPDEVPCPVKPVNDFLLYARRDHIGRYNLVTKQTENMPIPNIKNVISVDFDMAANCIYWADITLDVISRQCFTNGSKTEILVSIDLSSIEGMAFDWISKSLYFVDGTRSTIEMIKTNVSHSGRMRRTILNSTVLHKPRGIALHPQGGYMFWSDWSADDPSINRANLDGSNNRILFGKDKVDWPNGITVDYIANRIYWVDAKRDYIGSSDLHGDGFVKVVADIDVVSHPFAIAVFKNTMYWDDWKRNSIFSADKENFKGVEVIAKQLVGLMDLKIFAHGIQIGTNACADVSCAYICVGLPKNKYTCLCPDGLVKKDDKCLCPGNVEPKADMTCPAVENTCSSDHFTCTNGNCIPKGWRCDGDDDCGDNSDELRCMPQTCPPTFFVCGDGKCLPNYFRCDFEKDCSDGSDEVGCPIHNCTEGYFTCSNGKCISMKWRCDGENDCRDGSDELNCHVERPAACKADEFQCNGGSVSCIPSTWKCDGEPDCLEGSDEANCESNLCSQQTQFSCGPPRNRCIYNTWVCDGDKDCPDGKDEMNCTTAKPQAPKDPEFNPVNGTCQDWMFHCNNQRCIPFWWKCDEVDDCGDGSDELGCPFRTHPTTTVSSILPTDGLVCDANQFQCASGICIFNSWLCDGMYDCPGQEDENNCDSLVSCSANQFKCKKDGNCIPMSKVCDGRADCPDETDELSCKQNLPNGPATPSCSYGMFPCDGSCYPLAFLCDGTINCKDGYDEMNCAKKSRIYQVMDMSVDQSTDSNTMTLTWRRLHPTKGVVLEYLPSISEAFKQFVWKNTSWINETEYVFRNLDSNTYYNLTVYVRIAGEANAFPPAKFINVKTKEGVPSEPLKLSVTQKNTSHVLISWEEPRQLNGVVTAYEISWISKDEQLKSFRLPGNETSHLLPSNFVHNVTYTFWVSAINSLHQSKKSEPFNFTYDGETTVQGISDLKVVQENEDNITIAWKYDAKADGFNVHVYASIPYPDLPSNVTKAQNITLKLAPGVTYRIEVNAFTKKIAGPPSTINIKTKGTPLPMILLREANLLKDVGNTVKLTWERPTYNSDKKINWLYGVYYGTSFSMLLEKPRILTSDENATVTNLTACEIYTFSVGIVGPLGYGPLSMKKQIGTPEKLKAPPKNLSVKPLNEDKMKMRIEWSPNCPMVMPDHYIIHVREKVTNRTANIRVQGKLPLSRTYDVSKGGIYEVSVASDEVDPGYSDPVIYYAPPLEHPIEFRVEELSNGSFSIDWSDHEDLKKEDGQYFYDVFVQDGNSLDEKVAQVFTVERPPFIYTNSTAKMYTFAVRVRSKEGLKSIKSELISKLNEPVPPANASIGMTAIVVSCVLVFIALVGAVAFLVVRNRKLRSSFQRFTNTHYDTRSEAATFEDNSLEEEETPQIRGFSDDEPLVIA